MSGGISVSEALLCRWDRCHWRGLEAFPGLYVHSAAVPLPPCNLRELGSLTAIPPLPDSHYGLRGTDRIRSLYLLVDRYLRCLHSCALVSRSTCLGQRATICSTTSMGEVRSFHDTPINRAPAPRQRRSLPERSRRGSWPFASSEACDADGRRMPLRGLYAPVDVTASSIVRM